MELSKYALEILREGREFDLYRGRQSGCPSVLVLSPGHDGRHAVKVEHLQREYALAAELDPSWALRPLALARLDGGTVLVLEDPGGHPLDSELSGRPLEMSHGLRIAVSLAAALRKVGARGLIHKDIKPSNVFVAADGHVRLSGFGLASHLPREHQTPADPEKIAGTLAYMAPEQTGRMNRSLDARSDLYALGVTLYELFTGVLPFSATDAMSWIHCHIARAPTAPSAHTPDMPRVLETILLRLLAKNAEDRYQTAAGVEADLQRCLDHFSVERRIPAFTLGKNDRSERLLLPERLYGRLAQIETLGMTLGQAVSRDATRLVLVSGHAGIGKSSLVRELHKVLVPTRGLIVSGKIDQYERGIPYAAITGALRELVHGLLGKSEAELSPWRVAVREALGRSGQLIVNLVPELALIIGQQPAVLPLGPKDEKSRFHLVIQRFLHVFAQARRPLALFLDDLQWHDAASLELLERLVNAPEAGALLLIGAYRDSEVDAAHPLAGTLAVLRGASTLSAEIVLSGLELDDVVQLLADALRAPPQHVLPLARLVREKTAGNPFFVLQFVAALAEQGLLTFDSASASWQWELARIRALAISDNVAELMAEKLSRLAPETQQALAQLACLGAIAEVSTVAYVSARSELELHATLGPAVRAGVISRAHGRYAFLHDRIQEAAYVLIPVPEQALHHLRLGRALALQAQAQELEPEIHPVVDQFNRGASLITSSEERVRVAQLNLRAGKRALAASAYSSASGYLAAGRELLPDEPWQTHYRLCFELELNRAHCEFLLGAHAVATELLVELSERATSAADLTAVASLRMLLCTTLDRVDEAIEVGLSCLGRAGITWSAHPDAKLVERELETLWQLLAGRPVEALIDLPRMRDPDWLATMEILDALIVPALFSDVQLVDLVLLRMTNLSIEHGNSDAGCNAYAALNIVLGFRAGEYQTAFRFGRLACELVDKRGMNRFEARVYVSFSNFVVPWTMPISGMRAVVSRGIAGAHALGDPTLAIYGLRALVSAQLRAGEPLAEVQRELEEALALTRKTSFALGVHSCLEQLILVRGLRGLSIDDLHEGGVPEGTRWFERQLEAGGERLAFAASWYWIHRIQSCFFAEDFTGALEAMPLAERLLPLTRAFMEVSDYHLYSALTHAASCDTTADSTREQHLTALLAHHTQLAIWGEKCPANFASCAALVAAEFARVNGDERQAERLYDEAMHAAQQRGAIHEEALACELAARFHRLRGFDLIADAYRSRARHCYARWGADGKVRQLDQSHRPGASPSSALAPGDTVDEPVEQWEVAAIFKAAQALSSEIELRSLIETLIRMAVEHAGAERGVLILLRLNEPLVAARAAMHQGRLEIALCESQVSGTDLPSSALNYVLRTRKRLILDDASLGDQLAGDAYVAQRQVRSVLCIPIIKQSVLVGMLYLENNLTAGAFTPRRITVLEFLASQAAISLDNAYLYADLARSEALLSEGQRVSHTGTWSWSPRDGKAVWSDELQRIFGYDPQQSPAGSVGAFIERIHPDDRTAVMQTVASIAREHAVHASDFRALLPDGSVKYLHAVGRPMRDEAGQVQSYIGSTMDITERKQSEDALRDARANLVHTSRLTTMGELAASIAHEVNQPLTAIVSNANSCLRFLSTDPPEVLRGIHAAERVVRDGLYAGEVIKRIRDVLRKAPRQLSAIDLNEVIRDVLDLIRSELHRHDVSLELELADGLAPVLVDRVQLQQVIANLAINAIEAMSERQSSSRILHVMTALERKGYAVARVRDSGAGVAVEQLDRIFDAFFSTKRDGLGMGLAVCRSIVEAHGGRLWASQSELHGATLQFTLPLAGS